MSAIDSSLDSGSPTSTNQLRPSLESDIGVEVTSSQDVIEDAGVTMCICPVCSFSAPSPHRLDEHMELAHGENSVTVQMLQNPGENLLVTESTPKRFRVSPPPMGRLAAGDAMDLSLNQQHETSFHDPCIYLSDSNFSSASPSFRDGGGCVDTFDDLSVERSNLDAKSSSVYLPEQSSTDPNSSLQADSRRRYRCNLCPAIFPWHGDLTEHLRHDHSVQKSRENSRSGKAGNFCCSCCKYVAKYQSELRRHMRLHWGVKPFACVFCPYRSAWKGDLKRHMESHHKECFTSEAELVKIMAQFKNNAGTATVGDGVSVEDTDEQPPSSSSPSTPPLRPPRLTTTGQLAGRGNSPLVDETNFETRDDSLRSPSLQLKTDDCESGSCDALLLKTEERGPCTFLPPAWMGSAPSSQFFSLPQIPQLDQFRLLTANHRLLQPPSNDLQLPTDQNQAPVPPVTSLQIWPNPHQPCSISPLQSLGVFQTAYMNVMPSMMSNLMMYNPEMMNNFLKLEPSTRQMQTENPVMFNMPLTRLPQYDSADASSSQQPLDLVCEKRKAVKQELNPSPPLTMPPSTTSTICDLFNQQLLHHIANSLNADQSKVQPHVPVSNWKHELPSQNPASAISTHSVKLRRSMPISASSASLMPTSREEQWKRFQCSGCGHRSNWKWDINKHIKVAHPERKNITTVTMGLEEAKASLPEYLDRLKGLRSGRRELLFFDASNSSSGSLPATSFEESPSTGEGYYRPFKCSVCGHRSNWKWDVKKHIKQMHAGLAEVVTLSLEEARRTIHQYKTHRRQGQSRYWLDSIQSIPTSAGFILPSSQFPPLKSSSSDSVGMKTTAESSSSVSYSTNEPAPSSLVIAAPSTAASSAFRCGICRRRFQTWSSLQLHSVFSHPSSSSSAKRSYKKALLQKALASPTVSIKKSPILSDTVPSGCESQPINESCIQRLPFTSAKSEIGDHEEMVQPPAVRSKLHARRSLRPCPPPLRPNLDTNRVAAIGSAASQATTIPTTPSDTNRAGELAQLLERVLQIVINVGSAAPLTTSSSTTSSMLLGFDQGSLECLSEAMIAAASGETSGDDSENVQTSAPINQRSEQLLNLLLQPQVQPLMSKISSLFQTFQNTTNPSHFLPTTTHNE